MRANDILGMRANDILGMKDTQIYESKIVQTGDLFKIENKTLFGWRTEKEWLGIDNLGYDYGYTDKVFKSIEEAEKYLALNYNSGPYPINIPRSKEKTSLSFKDEWGLFAICHIVFFQVYLATSVLAYLEHGFSVTLMLVIYIIIVIISLNKKSKRIQRKSKEELIKFLNT